MFAMVEKGSKCCFAGQDDEEFENQGEDRDGSIFVIRVVFISEVELCCSATFCMWLGQ